MSRIIPLGALLLLSALAIGALACGTTEAKPALPYAYPPSFGSAHNHGFESSEQPNISISGEGRATAPPDVARVQVNISVRRPTAAEARDEGKAAISALLETLDGNGVAREDVETRSFSISPVTRRDEETGESETVEYQLHNVSQLTLRDVDRLGALLDELVDSVGESLRVSGITLAIEDPHEIQRQAREKAMEDALAKAQQLAELSGVQLGPPISISESTEGTPRGLLSKEVLVTPAEEGLAPGSVGELEAAVSVYVVYGLVAP